MYTTYKDKKLVSPDDGVTEDIDPILLTNFGPPTKNSTLLDNLSTELDLTV